ncbi:hypothetical protein DPMN_193291 [Dreissena polymorpha]|uniref:Uncharacterized protein n=1 Tax=Dreissena polymorpha TaxID=45954 RepID=A0A9D4BF22_DREPO|nr:hypothetical protein DPMN_193270 [Dreissena polymorpha]KAH3692954.1 hypothetical protein DPMN_193291 [Dreissena polymorpha]
MTNVIEVKVDDKSTSCTNTTTPLRNSARRHLASDYQASYQYLLPYWVHQYFQKQSLGEFDFRLSIDVA